MNPKSESGYILPSVLLVIFLIISLLLSLLAVVAFNNRLDIKRLNKKRLDLACYSAVQKHLASHSSELDNGSYDIVVDSIKVNLSNRLKGLFLLITADTKKNRDSSKVSFLFNREVTPEFENALILSKPNINPIVSGVTRIVGDILMYNKQITKGSIYGLKTADNNFHNGVIKSSKDISAKYFRDTLIKFIFRNEYSSGLNLLDNSVTLSPAQIDTMKNTYINGDLTISGTSGLKINYSDLRIFCKGKVLIRSGTTLSRELGIKCDSSCVIEDNTKLENLLIISGGSVSVGKNSELKTAQIFSREGISCDGAVFNFPSVLCTYCETGHKENWQNKLELKSTILNGTAMLICDVAGVSGNLSKINIDEKSKIQGALYSENYSEIHGAVLGSVYTWCLWYYKSPTEYINWLVDLSLNRNELDSSFTLPFGFNGSKKYKRMNEAWIY